MNNKCVDPYSDTMYKENGKIKRVLRVYKDLTATVFNITEGRMHTTNLSKEEMEQFCKSFIMLDMKKMEAEWNLKKK